MRIQKISDLIKNLERIKEESGDLDLVFSVDDEGNAFDKIYFTPTVGYFQDRGFYTEQEYSMFEKVVCIN